LRRLRPLRLDGIRLGVRHAAPEAGDHRRPVLGVDGAAADGGRRGAVPGVVELRRDRRHCPGRGVAGVVDALRMNADVPTGDFDLNALYQALDAQRQSRGLTWAQATGEMSRVGPVIRRHPIASSTITGLRTKGLAEADGVLQMLRWLGRAPESFMRGSPGPIAASSLP